jgi:outer membrane protein OmpA-like peptidoglycan-associated protein
MTATKKIMLLALLIIPACTMAQFGSLLNKVKNKVNQRVDNKVDKAIDKELDKAEGKKTNSTGTTNNSEKEEPQTPQETNSLKSFSKYDFIPGEKILYAEDFALENVAELPTGWNTNGSAEVVTLSNYPGKWLQLHKSFIYLSSNSKELGQDYTVEFDLILNLKNNGWLFPSVSVGLFASGELSTTDNTFLKNYNKNASVKAIIQPGIGNSRLQLQSSLLYKDYFNSNAKEYKELDQYFGKPVHVAMQVQKERLRVWINEVKAFDAPRAIPANIILNQLFFEVSSTNYAEDQYGIYVGNLKLATGLPDTHHQLIEEGKFSTTGILFDVNSANIKPESMGVLKEIAAVIKENPSIRLKIVGHTSSDGDDKVNLELSLKRAIAVKDMLIKEWGIDAATMETEGKGETQPVADNNSKEGKAANRRVEFIKL